MAIPEQAVTKQYINSDMHESSKVKTKKENYRKKTINALFVWSQDSQNPVSISLSRESCLSYPHPGVLFMVGWLKRIPS